MTFTGQWRCRIHTPLGAQEIVLAIAEHDGVLAGEARGAEETVAMIAPRSCDGRLFWTQKVTRPMRLTVAFDVRIEDGRLVGTAKAGLLPRVRVEGDRIADPSDAHPGSPDAAPDRTVDDGGIGGARTWPRLSVDTADRGRRPVVGMLVFPGMTALDLVGPHQVLSGPCDVLLIGAAGDPVTCDTGIVISPDAAIAEAPTGLDVLFVPGGPGQTGVMADDAALAFLADRGARARYVTSACTGSLILGAAGLLDGYRATTHWAALDLLRTFGAEPVDRRVVVDRNRITGGGVTAGIDFGLVLLRNLFDEQVARTTQLLMEYAPQPPFAAGRPDEAGEDVVAEALRIMAPAAEDVMQAIAARQRRITGASRA